MTRNSFADDSSKQRCFEEMINKERDTRLGWYFKASKERDDDDKYKSRQYEVFRKRLEAACPRPNEAQIRLLRDRPSAAAAGPASSHPHAPMLLPSVAEGDQEPSLQPLEISVSQRLPLPPIGGSTHQDMNPVDGPTKDKLYEGLSKEGKGRYSYLQTRKDLSPEEKYNLPLVSSWEYGWRLNDVIKIEALKNPIHGRSRVIHDTFYRRNGFSH